MLELCYAQLNRAVEAARQEGGSDMYETPVLTRIADFADATNGAGHAPLKDVWGFRALAVVYWPWS